jgi:GNAT superfamily N-acetyltransferase
MDSFFQIRKATENDIPAILSLVKQLAIYEKLANEAVGTEENFRKYGFGESPFYHVFLAVDQSEKPLGFALYFFTFSTFLAQPTLYLEDLFVLPEHRGKGIGKALLKTLAKVALAQSCGRMEWAVLDWNRPSIEFYLKLGAKPMSDWTTYRLQLPEIEKLAKDN